MFKSNKKKYLIINIQFHLVKKLKKVKKIHCLNMIYTDPLKSKFYPDITLN